MSWRDQRFMHDLTGAVLEACVAQNVSTEAWQAMSLDARARFIGKLFAPWVSREIANAEARMGRMRSAGPRRLGTVACPGCGDMLMRGARDISHCNNCGRNFEPSELGSAMLTHVVGAP